MALLPRNTRAGKVHGVLNLRLGSGNSLKDRAWEGYLTGKMLLRGTRFHTSNEIRQAVAEAGAVVNISSRPQDVTISFSTDRKHVVPVLQLVIEALRHPALLKSDLQEFQRAAILSAREEHASPEWTAWNAINRVLHPYPPGDVRQILTAEEKIAAIKRVTVKGVRRFHADFYGASAGELALVDDFDPDQLLAAAEFGLRNWASPLPFRAESRSFSRSKPADIRLHQPGRHNSVFEAGMAIALDQNSPEYPALLLGANLMSGGFLNSRLPSRIRRQDGLSYWVKSVLYSAPFDHVATFLTTAACEPENMLKVRSAFFSELRGSLREGFTAAEVEAGKQGWLRAQQLATSRDGDLAAALTLDLFAERPATWRADLQAQVASLAPAR